MPVPPLAHLGHWYVSLPVFMGPVLLLVIALKVNAWRERRHGPDRSGKRSSVTTTHNDGKAILTVTGPLDYPALLDIESELGKTTPYRPEILLDLRHLTSADKQAAWDLCDVVGRAHASNHISALICPGPAMHALRTACAAEGIRVGQGGGPDRRDSAPGREELA
jgi:ABC-type transporter Mla MlaB component